MSLPPRKKNLHTSHPWAVSLC